MNSIKHHQHPLLIIKIYKVFTFTTYNSKISSIERANHQHHYLLSKLYIVFTLTVYNSKMSSIERANNQHPSSNTQHLSAHQHLTPNTHHPTLRSLKLAKEASIVLREEAEVAYTILEVSDTLNTHTEGITCIYA